MRTLYFIVSNFLIISIDRIKFLDQHANTIKYLWQSLNKYLLNTKYFASNKAYAAFKLQKL